MDESCWFLSNTPTQICDSFYANIGRDFNQTFVPNGISRIQDCPVPDLLLGLMLSSGSSHRSFEVIDLKGTLQLTLNLSCSYSETEFNLSGPWVILKTYDDAASDPWVQNPLVLNADLLSICLSLSLCSPFSFLHGLRKHFNAFTWGKLWGFAGPLMPGPHTCHMSFTSISP